MQWDSYDTEGSPEFAHLCSTLEHLRTHFRGLKRLFVSIGMRQYLQMEMLTHPNEAMRVELRSFFAPFYELVDGLDGLEECWVMVPLMAKRLYIASASIGLEVHYRKAAQDEGMCRAVWVNSGERFERGNKRKRSKGFWVMEKLQAG